MNHGFVSKTTFEYNENAEFIYKFSVIDYYIIILCILLNIYTIHSLISVCERVIETMWIQCAHRDLNFVPFSKYYVGLWIYTFTLHYLLHTLMHNYN